MGVPKTAVWEFDTLGRVPVDEALQIPEYDAVVAYMGKVAVVIVDITVGIGKPFLHILLIAREGPEVGLNNYLGGG